LPVRVKSHFVMRWLFYYFCDYQAYGLRRSASAVNIGCKPCFTGHFCMGHINQSANASWICLPKYLGGG